MKLERRLDEILIARHQDESAYEALSTVLTEWAIEHNKYETLIVDIKTIVLGTDRIIAIPNGFDYDFDSDWYEGGDIYLLGIMPISEITIAYEF